jgi:hypothetical protein
MGDRLMKGLRTGERKSQPTPARSDLNAPDLEERRAAAKTATRGVRFGGRVGRGSGAMVYTVCRRGGGGGIGGILAWDRNGHELATESEYTSFSFRVRVVDLFYTKLRRVSTKKRLFMETGFQNSLT